MMTPKSMPASQYQPQDACQLSHRQTQYFHTVTKENVHCLKRIRLRQHQHWYSSLVSQSKSGTVAYFTDFVIS